MVNLHMGDACHLYNCSKPIECTQPRVSPEVNYGLWVMTCPGRIDCDVGTTVMQDVDSVGGCAGIGQGGIWKLSEVSAQFKTSWKKIINLKTQPNFIQIQQHNHKKTKTDTKTRQHASYSPFFAPCSLLPYLLFGEWTQ